MKKIIFRIIVAVAVAFILSKMKLLGILQVNAKEKEVFRSFPSDIYFYKNYDITNGYASLDSFSIYNKEWRGKYYPSTLGVHSAVSLLFYTPDLNSNDIYKFNVSFLTNANIIGSSNPVRAYMLNDIGTTSVCEVFASETTCTQEVGNNTICNTKPFSSSYMINIVCPNVVIGTNQRQRIFLQSAFNSGNIENSFFFASSIGSWYQDDTTEALENIVKQNKETNDLLKDDSSISNDKITDITNIDTNTSNTPVSDFITLPITLLNKYNSSMNSSCSSINLGSLLGTNLIFPCINLEQRLGSNLWNIIDKLFSFFMVFNIAMFCVSIFERLTSLHDDFYSAYEPQHAYNGKHGGGS